VLGALLALLGIRRGLRGAAGDLPALATGAGLVVRAMANQPLRRALGLDRRGAVEVRKTLEVGAPVGEVFALRERFEEFPRFMDHVLEVRREPAGRSHWRVRSAAGTDLEWDAEVTQRIADRVLAWKTLPGAPVAHSGVVRFEAVSSARTRIDVRMSYAPPAGVLGHGVASLFRVGPRVALDEDLVRLKSLLERGRTTAHGQTVTQQQLATDTRQRRP
jgi:uncharacterized membrane protein